MTQIFDHIVDLFAAIIIIFLFPLIYFGQKQDSLIQTLVSVETETLVDDIRSKGYITKEMYDRYTWELSQTGLLYEISMKHKKIVNEPDYRFRTEDEVIEEQNAAYTGSNIYEYFSISTEIPAVLDPVAFGPMNTETNASVLSSAINTPASISHVHTSSCYSGHRHTDGAGLKTSSYQHGCYTISSNASSICYGNLVFIGVGTVMTTSCPSCGKTTYDQYVDVFRCTKCSTTWQVPAGNKCSSCGYGSGYMYSNYTLICSAATNNTVYSCPLIEDTTLDCNTIVMGIMPTHPIQTVAIGDSLITTVSAVYEDGSTKVVEGMTSYSTAAAVQNQKAVITYTYSIDGVSYAKTCDITVTVIPRNKVCINGHTYHLKADASDPGCPYCKAWLSSLTITYPITGSLAIYKGTTLSNNGVTLLATYLDGHTQILYNEYIDNLDDNYVGTQNVSISYKGKYVNLTVITKRVLKQCLICNRYYELYPDITDPGCPYCQALTPIFTGNVMRYYDEYYSADILQTLYEGNGTYYFSDKDYLIISIASSSKSWGMRLITIFLKGHGDNGTQTVYGGYIREDGYLE